LVLGADRVLAVDIDGQALRATRENADKNQVAERLEIERPETASRDQTFDRVVANILSGPLIELAPELRGFCRTGTGIALSGILTHQTESVAAAYGPWVEFEPPFVRDDWALLAGTVITI
jgi:ribosomal protein L11 methyltransferase